MPYCRCGTEFSEARARLGFDCCLECGKKEATAEIARRNRMIAPISHKSEEIGPQLNSGAQPSEEALAIGPILAEAGATPTPLPCWALAGRWYAR